MERFLDGLCPGTEAVVRAVETEEELKNRLRDFGLVPGTRVRCCYRSPGGQVTAIRCRGSVIALRTRDLRAIRVRCL